MPSNLSPFTCCVRQGGDTNSTMASNRGSLRWQAERNKQIDRDLRRENQRLRSRQMVLLLGTGESGKSTFLKQMRLIHGKTFSKAEMIELKDTIYNNIYEGVLYLLHARESLRINWHPCDDMDKLLSSAKFLENHYTRTRATRRERQNSRQPVWTEEEFLAIVSYFQTIWANGAIKEAFKNRAKLLTENFSENSRYYLDRLHQIGANKYIPTNEDIVWSRKATESIIEEEFSINHSSILFVDVGGQTKERRKWCRCFDGMTSVLFLIACSHFDEHYQDRITKEYRNKLAEAMSVFENLINHEAFRLVSIIIFFNKTDLLKEKIAAQLSNIRVEFPQFPANSNPHSLNDVQTFMVESFVSVVDHTPVGTAMSPTYRLVARTSSTKSNKPVVHSTSQLQTGVRKRVIYKHFTTAVDRGNMEVVCNAVQDIVLQNNLRRILMS